MQPARPRFRSRHEPGSRASLPALVIAITLSLASCGGGLPGAEAPAPPPPPPEGTHFVSPAGSDRGPGTEAGPWLTLQHAIDRLEPGDVLIVEPGTYVERLSIAPQGTADEPIVIRARQTGTVIIDGAGGIAIADRGDGISHLTLSGLTVANASRGVFLDAPVNGLTIADCAITGCANALLVYAGRDLTLRDLRVTDCHDGIGLGVKGQCGIDGVEITGCTVTRELDFEGDDNVDGIRVEGLCTGLHVAECQATGYDDSGFDIKPDNALVERCLAHHNGDNGFKLWGAGARLVNCIARDNADTGVTLADAVEMYHCTVAFNGRAALRPGGEDITQIVVRNCIIAYNFVRQYVAQGGPGIYDDDYNLYYAVEDELIWKVMDGDRGAYTLQDLRGGALPMGAHDIFADPRFASVIDTDLSLRAGSPAVDAGLPLDFVTVDFAGVPRDDRPDIGALERQ